MSGIRMNLLTQFKPCTLITLVILVLLNKSASGRTIELKNYRDVMIPNEIIQCRAACIDKFLLETDNMIMLPNCHDHNNCAMCWDFCQTLFIEERHIFKSICTNHTCVSLNQHFFLFSILHFPTNANFNASSRDKKQN